MKKKQSTVQEKTYIQSVLYGLLGSSLLMLVAAAIFAICINNEYIGIKYNGLCAHIIRFISAFAGCIIAVRMAKLRYAITAMLCAGVYCLVLLIGTWLFGNGVGDAVLPGILTVLLAGVAAIFIMCYKKKAWPRRKRRKQYC